MRCLKVTSVPSGNDVGADGTIPPLAGVRIVDLSTTFMGPYCTMLLGQWGADVIKVEHPSGDILRYIGDRLGVGLGPVFINANQGKRSISLDLKAPESRPLLAALIEKADVFVHNMRQSGAERLGLAAADVTALNPGIIYCHFRGYGRGGPYADLPAYDDVIQGAVGMAAVQGGRGNPPQYVRHAAADKTTGLMGAAAVLAALIGRGNSPAGRVIEVPMYETMASFMLLDGQGDWVYDPPKGPAGYARTESPSRRPFRTKDGYIAVMIYTDSQWAAFFTAMGKAHLAQLPRFATIRDRTIHTDELYELVSTEMQARTTGEWLAAFQRINVAAGPIRTIEDLFCDPHLAETRFFASLDDPHGGPLRVARSPVRMDGAAAEPKPAPVLGQHSREILLDAGIGAEDIEALVARGVVVDHCS
jgi:crotonobetainyl-CoA:carnitine CoA-transferase CaiB-like acyl-CoA transferase